MLSEDRTRWTDVLVTMDALHYHSDPPVGGYRTARGECVWLRGIEGAPCPARHDGKEGTERSNGNQLPDHQSGQS